MKLDLEDVRAHHRSLTDAGLLEIDRGELTEAARKCLDQEFAARGMERKAHEPEPPVELDPPRPREMREWRGEPVCVHAAESFNGRDDSPSMDTARAALTAAGIPWSIESKEKGPSWSGPRPAFDIELRVPAELFFEAHSVLDVRVFNPETERQWKAMLEELSDADFRAIRIEDLVAGSLDYAARLRRAYEKEMARRESLRASA